VLDPPVPAAYGAIARDAQGTEIGTGGGGAIAEALRCITRRSDQSRAATPEGYPDEPPF
jgi:hypothetical protein